MTQDWNVVESKITELQQQTKAYLSEVKKRVTELQYSDSIHLISFFTYSLDIAHDPEQESLCIGSYHVHNLGSKPITNPYLCIKMPSESVFSFSGKYVYEHFNQSLKAAGGWERINEKENKEEFWLRPLGRTSIEPNEILSFTDFQIKWMPKKPYAGSIMGFTYCDEIKEGVGVLNPINLNGTVHLQEDEHE